jgi:uncharacterized phage protein (TIGR01671 family)
MREIKFRGKAIEEAHSVHSHQHVKDGEWLYGDLAQNKDKGVMWVDTWHVIPSTVGQYTGLKDKNGKEIYEGDIVKADMLYVIVFEEDWATFRAKSIIGFGEMNMTFSRRMEVVGNIHDNPEMLEGEKAK